MSTVIAPTRKVTYPESDGKPMGETDLHRDLMTDLIFALKLFLANLRVYVAGNLFVYYEAGNPRAVVAPDVFVVLGIEQRRRRVYKAWEEGDRLPDMVIELTSKKTAEADRTTKPELYARLGVREYFLFDPYGEHLKPQLQGYRLVNGAYVPMQEYPLQSQLLGLELRAEEGALRLYNPLSGERLPNPLEAELARRAAVSARNSAEEKLEAAVEARREAEARAAEQAARAAEQAARAAEQAARAAEQAARASSAEAEIDRLRALLERQGE